ncbi:DUF6234 family protein [Streptomyces violens]|uniref:DUF6234 family protein n=1 Tax=Streptomyces violens TaxID=66377 RepID=UPI0004BF7AEA|nr:DUF6234 family protein [Streptomyces violens]
MVPDSSPAPGRPRVHWFADLFLALLVLVVEAAAVVVVWFAAGFYAWTHHGGDTTVPDPEGPDPTDVLLIALGVVALLAALISFRRFRARSPVTAVTQGVAAAVLALGALTGTALEYRATHPEPVPTSDRSGPVGCRSGGDSEECRDTGG